jgi:cysteine-rich repeat protein
MGSGCEDLTSDETAHSAGAGAGDPAAVADGRLQLSFHYSDGTTSPGRVFAMKDWVHLRTRLAVGVADFHDGDLAFVVVDAQGRQASTDALDCRRFRVGMERARIVEVYPGVDAGGVPCQHAWGYHDNGTLMPKLAPFADVPANAGGLMEYEVRVARVEHLIDGVFPEDAHRGSFFVEIAAEPEPACGDGEVNEGEDCDDGNTADGDGCSSACKWEACCDGPCCGNGQINKDEDCDDGNTSSGDGCSATCKVEIIH